MIDPARLWATDWTVCGFFAYLMVLVIRRPLPHRHRVRVLFIGAVCAGLAVMLSQLRLSPVLQVLREWVPAIFLLQGYWLCGLFFQRPMTGAERRLVEIDRTVFRLFRLTEVLRGPRIVLEYFEFTYLLAYPFIPVSFALFLGFGGRSAVDSFWATALIAGYGAYGVLPWIQTRPPRILERANPLEDRHLFFRRLNASVLQHASVQVNTFPSGHASVVVATALAVATVNSPAGLICGVVAASITSATVLGRYHYTADSGIGVRLGIIAWWLGFHVL